MAVQKNRGGVTTTGAQTVVVTDSFSRPANTTQYTANDVVSDDDHMTFSGCAQVNGGSGQIVSAWITSSTNEATKPDQTLWIFDTEPTAMEDNAAFDPTDSEMENVIATIDFAQANWKGGLAGASGTGNARCEGSTGIYPFVCASDSMSLYGILVENSTYTPISAEEFNVFLSIQQD